MEEYEKLSYVDDNLRLGLVISIYRINFNFKSLLDSGSSNTVLSLNEFKKLNLNNIHSEKSNLVMKVANG